ncbi:hypothetical protein ACWN83_05620 [Pseudolactococcus plantarum]|uniref:hypothetical protein n=1 Tax=Pseudolactococcus plantarum TaxID=1365 RepID=UPI000ABA2CE3|nr:hypothetical protein [Lactococcus plantarum]
MYYEVVTLKDKLVVGITDRTNNTAPDVGEKISQCGNVFTQMKLIVRYIIA